MSSVRSNANPFRYFKTSPEVIRLAVMTHSRFPPSLRNVEAPLHERGINVKAARHNNMTIYLWRLFGRMA